MKRILFALILLPALATGLSAKTKVVASVNDLAWLAGQIGDDRVEVSAVASPKADVHFVEVRPSYMRKLSRADVVLKVGLDLDLWMDRLIDGSRNSNLTIVDCAKFITPLEVPTFKADARYGDLHPYGNPHYWLGPDNLKPITDAIVAGLADADPEGAELFRANQQRLLERLAPEIERLKQEAAPLNGKEVIFYHDSWPYFERFTGLKAAGFIEPYPGVAPSPSHIKEIIDLVKKRHIKVIAVEPYFDKRVPDKIAQATGARVVTLYPSLGGRDKNESYVQWLEGNIRTLLEAFQ